MKPAAIKPAVSSAATIGVASLFNNHYLCPMFTFKQFIIEDAHCAMKVGTDGVLLGAWADVAGCRHITDIGCGSGLIALMAAQRAPEARVTGVEIDPEAVADARANVAASPFASRTEIVLADVCRYAATAPKSDCLLSNPPYHEEDLLPPAASRATARHTSGGGMGFEALLRVACQLLDSTDSHARFSLILPTQALPRFLPLAAVHGFHETRRTDVVTRPGKPPKRTLLELRPHPAPMRRDELVLVGDDGGRSKAYAHLCRDFYLDKS